MPSDWIIKFVGHIVENKRPENFPRTVESGLVVQVNELEQLRESTNDKLVHIIRNNGMVVPKDPTEMRSMVYAPDAHIFVPLHMIAFIETVTKKLASSVPDEAAKGPFN